MGAEDVRGARGEGRVDEDRAFGNALGLDQRHEVDQQFLRPLDGEGRDQQRLAAAARLQHFGQQGRAPRGFGQFRAHPVAIGRFADQMVDPGRARRIGLQQLRLRADVAGEEQPLSTRLDLDRGRAEQVAGVPETRAHVGCHVEPSAVALRPEGFEAGLRILERIDRLDLMMPAPRIAAVELLDLHLLDMARIRQHHRAEIGRRGGGVDRSLETCLHELRQQSAVIDMRMGENHCMDLRRLEREGPIVELLLRFRTLEHAAVDQHARSRMFDHEAGTGDRVTGSVKRQAHRIVPMRPAYWVSPEASCQSRCPVSFTPVRQC